MSKFKNVSKASKSMFPDRQFDMWFYNVNKVAKQDLKMKKTGLKLSQSLWHG